MKEKENEDELKDELKLREYKITELSNFIEELKEKHKIEIATLNVFTENNIRSLTQI